MASWPPNVVSTIIYLAPSEASSHSTHSKRVETKQKSEPKGSKMCFSRPNYKGASAMTTGQVLSHITAISCFVSVLGWKKCVSPPIALLRWKPCWFGSLTWHVIPSKTYRKHSAKPVRISKALAPHIFQVIEFSPPRSFQSARPTGRSETHPGRDRGRCRGCLLVFGSLRLPIQEANVVGHQAGLGLPEGGGIVFSGTSAKRLGANLDTESRS